MAFGIYDVDGKVRLTQSPGVGFVGRYAPDGSMYYTLAPGSGFCGVNAPDGSIYVEDATGSSVVGRVAKNGALRVTSNVENNGALRVSGFTYTPTNFVYITTDRTPQITVSATPGLMVGTLSQLVNGNISDTGVYFLNGLATAGRQLIFYFNGATAYIDEAKLHTALALGSVLGTWKWQGSNDGSTWTDIGSSFALSNTSTPVAMTSLNGNLTGWKYYALTGVSGSTNSGPWITEFQFRQGS